MTGLPRSLGENRDTKDLAEGPGYTDVRECETEFGLNYILRKALQSAPNPRPHRRHDRVKHHRDVADLLCLPPCLPPWRLSLICLSGNRRGVVAHLVVRGVSQANVESLPSGLEPQPKLHTRHDWPAPHRGARPPRSAS